MACRVEGVGMPQVVADQWVTSITTHAPPATIATTAAGVGSRRVSAAATWAVTATASRGARKAP